MVMRSNGIHQNLPDRVGPADSSFQQEEGKNRAVVIPVRNRADQLEKCLESLCKQEFAEGQWEVLVCDDGSTTDISEMVNRFRDSLPGLRLLRQPALGPAAARNLGFRSSSAAIFVCMDSDVTCGPDFFRRLVEALKLHPEWIAAEAAIRPVEGDEGPLWDAPVCGHGGRYHTAAMAYRRDALIEAGGLDEKFHLAACEDVELAVRLLQQGPIGFVPEAIVFHPRRRVTLSRSWFWRQHWPYVMILAKRYGFLSFPGRAVGRLPRLRVAAAAVLTLPGGRFLNACGHFKCNPAVAMIACLFALFDVACGICALPDILFSPVPPRKNYLLCNEAAPEALDP